MPATDELPQLSQAYMENSRWLMDHLPELARTHPNQWVAVYGGEVVAADPELGLVSAVAARSAPSSDTVIHFVDDGSLIFLFSPA